MSAAPELVSETQAFTEILWAGLEGWAYVATFANPEPAPGNGLTHTPAHPEPHWVSWPREAHKVVEIAEQYGQTHSVYFTPALHSKVSVKLDSPITDVHWLWADLDHDLSADQRRLLDELGGMRVASGTGTHLYVRLAGYVTDSALLAHYNQRLARGLGADAKWQHNSLLRLPGTYNHKRLPDLLPVRVLPRTWPRMRVGIDRARHGAARGARRKKSQVSNCQLRRGAFPGGHREAARGTGRVGPQGATGEGHRRPLRHDVGVRGRCSVGGLLG